MWWFVASVSLRTFLLIQAADCRCRYDPNTIAAETYDWRLSTPNMEKRDAYFTRLQARIELVHQVNGIKVGPLHSFSMPHHPALSCTFTRAASIPSCICLLEPDFYRPFIRSIDSYPASERISAATPVPLWHAGNPVQPSSCQACKPSRQERVCNCKGIAGSPAGMALQYLIILAKHVACLLCLTLRFESIAKVLAKCMLKYHRTSKCGL